LEQKARLEELAVAPLAASGLRSHLKDVHILHAHTGRAQTIAFLPSAGLALKRVVTRHVAFEPRHPLVHRLKYTRTCDGIIAVSHAVFETLLRAGIPGDRIEVIPTGVDFPALPIEQQPADADFVVGHLGAFTSEKGQDVAVEAARLLTERLPGLRMILAGEGPLRAALTSSPRVVLPGHIADTASFFAGLDLFIMPSRSEAWGLAALEAMAFGLPVIASNVGGLPEMIDDNETGWLIPPDDPSALAEAIFRAFLNRERLREMGQLARTRAQRFSVEETARRTEEFYLRLLNRSATT
jgi:glycosyltransferase involved in cell wall biosynthesis